MSKIPRPVRRAVATSKAYKAVFDSIDGKLVLIDLIKQCGILDASHEDMPGLNDWKNGRRSVVLDILKQLRFDEGGLLELVQARLDENPEEE